MTPSFHNSESCNPSFPGGAVALQQFVDQTKQPIPSTTGATVFVEFIVDIDGSVGDYVVLKGAGMEADLEAVRIVSTMPAWVPGTVDGEPARFKFVLPINFKA